MPLPLAVLAGAAANTAAGVAIAAGVRKVVGTIALGVAIDARESVMAYATEKIDEVKSALSLAAREEVVAQAQARGVALDPADPWGGSSLTRAVSDVSGIPLTDITSASAIVSDVGAWGAGKLREHTGIDVGNLSDPAAVRAGLNQSVQQAIAQRGGADAPAWLDADTRKAMTDSGMSASDHPKAVRRRILNRRAVAKYRAALAAQGKVRRDVWVNKA